MLVREGAVCFCCVPVGQHMSNGFATGPDNLGDKSSLVTL